MVNYFILFKNIKNATYHTPTRNIQHNFYSNVADFYWWELSRFQKYTRYPYDLLKWRIDICKYLIPGIVFISVKDKNCNKIKAMGFNHILKASISIDSSISDFIDITQYNYIFTLISYIVDIILDSKFKIMILFLIPYSIIFLLENISLI